MLTVSHKALIVIVLTLYKFLLMMMMYDNHTIKKHFSESYMYGQYQKFVTQHSVTFKDTVHPINVTTANKSFCVFTGEGTIIRSVSYGNRYWA